MFYKSLGLNFEIKEFTILGEIGPKLPLLHQISFFGKFHSCGFYLPMVPYHDVKFQKNP